MRLLLFVGVSGFLSYLLFMKRTLRHLDPSSVIPGRVKTALDVLAEGVVLVDGNERIVLANDAFVEKTEQETRLLMGKKLSSLGWREPGDDEVAEDFPWDRAMIVGEAHTGTSLCLPSDSGVTRSFVVNAAPIRDEDGKARGVMVTFDDTTELEAKNVKLRRTLDELRESRDEVERQNDQLQFLASRDPLTGLLNRRSFFERYERDFEIARHSGKALSIIMTDIDHFKNINDTHGHAVGDQVIQMVSENLTTTLRDSDIVCRYGGEEFVVVLPGIDLEQASQAAERIRANLAGRQENWGRVTGKLRRGDPERGIRQPGRADRPGRPGALRRQGARAQQGHALGRDRRLLSRGPRDHARAGNSSSMARSASSGRRRPAALMLSSSCSGRVTPTMTLETPGSEEAPRQGQLGHGEPQLVGQGLELAYTPATTSSARKASMNWLRC